MLDKLVRDNIPQIIRNDGDVPETHIAGNEEYLERLCDKLVEEAEEYRESREVEELADIMEVIVAIRKYQNLSSEEIDEKIQEKRGERGGFEDRIVLDDIK